MIAVVLDLGDGPDIGIPTSVNGIRMSLAELIDSLGTIGAAHGIDRPEAALGALNAASRALRSSAPARAGSTRLQIAQGCISVIQPEFATT